MPEIILPSTLATFSERGKGTYILILRLVTPTVLTIGKFGTFPFLAGWYAYVGSAFGAGGLRGRLKHHLSPVKKPHWHIDYLRLNACVHEVWYLISETAHEHVWAAVLCSMPNAVVPVPRFGASDCDCQTHLFHFVICPDFAEFSALIHLNDGVRNVESSIDPHLPKASTKISDVSDTAPPLPLPKTWRMTRVLLKNAPILILDEATANLDALTEQAVWDGSPGNSRTRPVNIYPSLHFFESNGSGIHDT